MAGTLCLIGQSNLLIQTKNLPRFIGMPRYDTLGVSLCLQGCGPTVVRAMVVNMAQLATYSQAKQMLLHSGYLQVNTLIYLILYNVLYCVCIRIKSI